MFYEAKGDFSIKIKFKLSLSQAELFLGIFHQQVLDKHLSLNPHRLFGFDPVCALYLATWKLDISDPNNWIELKFDTFIKIRM